MCQRLGVLLVMGAWCNGLTRLTLNQELEFESSAPTTYM